MDFPHPAQHNLNRECNTENKNEAGRQDIYFIS